MGAGVPGRFRAWEQAGLMAVLATDPALGFLATVSGAMRETVSAAIDLVNEPVWNGVKPTVVVSAEFDEAAGKVFPAAGLVRMADRVLAVKRLESRPAFVAQRPTPTHLDIVDAGADETFLHTLLAGYEVDGVVAEFIRAEHRLPMMRRFLVLEDQAPIAAAAVTIHGDVAVLGGASTLPTHRGQGAQSQLLQHRLRIAAEAGCVLAAATARPDSVSAANLRKAGFGIHRRSAWAKA
jgi:GNAT superfamily N-acetyltransferase